MWNFFFIFQTLSWISDLGRTLPVAISVDFWYILLTKVQFLIVFFFIFQTFSSIIEITWSWPRSSWGPCRSRFPSGIGRTWKKGNWRDFLYFFLHKSWIWRTLGHVMNIFSYWHFHNASKEYFWSKNRCMKFEFFFGQKHSFEALWKWQIETIFTTCPRVHQIQDLCRKKCKKGIF